MKIYIWPDGTWMFPSDNEPSQWKGDDFQIVEIDDESILENIDLLAISLSS